MSFTHDKNIIKIDNSITMNTNECLDQALHCWSPALGFEVWLDGDSFDIDEWEIEETDEKPGKDCGMLVSSWTILTNKKGKQVFWTNAIQFDRDEFDMTMEVISNAGLDIDVDTELSIEDNGSNFQIILSDKDGFTWPIGTIDDLDGGKMTMFSAIESNEPTDEDEDGDAIFKPVDQVKFETARQLFVKAGFKVKMRRYQR